MRLVSLKLEQFRNYGCAEVTLENGLTVLEGRNGTGKTNFLEALWLLSGARSVRASRDDQLIKKGAPLARLAAEFKDQERQREIILLIERGLVTRKRWRLERAPHISKEIQGLLPMVLFQPSDLDLLGRSSAARRNYLDQILVRTSRVEADLVRRVEKILQQRRAALEILQSGGAADLSSLDQQLVQYGTELSLVRRQLVKTLKPLVNSIYGQVSEQARQLEVTVSNPNDIDFAKVLPQLHQQEIAAGRNLVGPQRDDLELDLGGDSLKEYGSRGEWRTAIIALKLAELEYLSKKIGGRPVLLLDDVLSELDNERRKILENWFSRQQTILATTDRHELSKSTLAGAAVFSVADINQVYADAAAGG